MASTRSVYENTLDFAAAADNDGFLIHADALRDAAEEIRRIEGQRDEAIKLLKCVASLRASIKTWAISKRIPGWQSEDDLFAAIEAAISKASAQ